VLLECFCCEPREVGRVRVRVRVSDWLDGVSRNARSMASRA